MSPRGRKGVVLILTLLGMTCLVAMIFFVYNMSIQVSQRVRTQNAADAVAVSGAGWMARSMNVIAMNNCAQSRMLALVPIFDSIPLAAEMAEAELKGWQESTEVLRGRGIPNPSELPRNAVDEALENLNSRYTVQYDAMDVFEDIANSEYDMREATYWRHPDGSGDVPYGEFWQSAIGLEEFSRATIENAERLAQSNAVRFGQANDMDGAFMLPIVPYLPAEQGSFSDFDTVLRSNIIVNADGAEIRVNPPGGAIPDMMYPHRLGPFANLFKWRHRFRSYVGGVYIPGDPGVSVPEPPGRWEGQTLNYQGSGGYWQGGELAELGYRTYGPFEWALNHVSTPGYVWPVTEEGEDGEESGNADSYFVSYIRRMGQMKMNYMFAENPPVTELYTMHYPDWTALGDYEAAKRIAEEAENALPGEPVPRVYQTLTYCVWVQSYIEPGKAGYLSDRITSAEDPWIHGDRTEFGNYWTNVSNPAINWNSRWVDPELVLNRMYQDVERIHSDAWKVKLEYREHVRDTHGQVVIDRTTGEPMTRTVYVTCVFIFGGIDVGGDVEIRNPCNYDAYDILPTPFLYDAEAAPYSDSHDEGARREYFTFLSVVSKDSEGDVWPEKFKAREPLAATVGVAQAELFNRSSWGLWTQDWQVQLVPVTQWEDWLEEMDEGEQVLYGGDPDVSEALEPGYVEEMFEYFRAIDPSMVERFMNH
jgi:hypothetical protein